MTPPRVLHVVPHLDRVGGYERQALALAARQRRQGSADPILLTHRDDADSALLERGLSGEVHRLQKGLLRHHPGSWWRRRPAGIELVHAHALHKLSGQVLALASAAGLPSLVKVATDDDVRMFADPAGWEHLLDGDDTHAGGLRWRLMIATAWRRLRRAGRFVALNSSIEGQLRERGLSCVRLPNGVDTQAFRAPDAGERKQARAELGLPRLGTVVVAVGRLCRRKRIDLLLDAFGRLVERGDATSHLLIVGEGPEQASLRARAGSRALRHRVSFTGNLPDVRTALFAADVCAHVADREGMPNAVLEALACGLACVLSDIPAHRDLLAGKAAALLFPAGDEAALAARLSGLVGGLTRRVPLGRVARDLAVTHYDLTEVCRGYDALYAELLGRPPQVAATE